MYANMALQSKSMVEAAPPLNAAMVEQSVLHPEASNDTENDDDDDDAGSISSLEMANSDDPKIHAAPTTGVKSPTIAAGLDFDICRHPSTNRCVVTQIDSTGQTSQAYQFVTHHSTMSKASRPEITLHPGNDNNSMLEEDDITIGSINFHHWLLDRSKSIIIAHTGTNTTTDLRCPGKVPRHVVSFTHEFRLPGSTSELRWERGESETRGERRRRCVDGSGEVYALLTCTRNMYRKKWAAQVRIVREGLRREDLEVLLLTVMALLTKRKKRELFRSTAGWTGGLGPTVGYVVAG